MSEVNSHIQITKSLLKNFQINKKQLFYLDIEENIIKKSSAKKLGTEYGYYFPMVEKFLNEEIESKIGDSMKLIHEFSKNKKNEIIIENVDEIKRFVEYSFIRGKYYLNQVKKKLEFNENKEIDRFIHNNLIYLHQEKIFLNEYNVGLFINCTETKFVTLSNTIYFYFNNEKTYIVFPITPKVAIYFIKENNNILSRYCEENRTILNCKHKNIKDEKIIQDLNKSALLTELLTSNKFIVGDEYELNRLNLCSEKLKKMIYIYNKSKTKSN